MRTTVSLEGMNALLEGRLGRPADVLGPQTISHEGRKMLAVRAFLPGSQQAWVVDRGQREGRPMRRIHPAGLYEALCPYDALCANSAQRQDSTASLTADARPSPPTNFELPTVRER